MTALNDFIREIHRRSVWQVLGIYLVGSWGALQVVEVVTETAGLPDWAPGMALVLLVIGLPICVATAFVQEGMPRAPDAPGLGVDGGAEGAEAAATGAATSSEPSNLAPGTGSLDRPTTRPSARARIFTWRNAVMGGLGAFTLLGITIFGYFVMWSSGIGPIGNLAAQGVFAEREPVVLADFSTATGDPGVGRLVTEALRVDLVESSALTVLPESYLVDAKQRMGLAADAVVTAQIAREVAQRDGIKAVIMGEVAALGGGYVLTASLLEAASGKPLAAFRETAETETDLLAAIDKLSERIRSKAGESLREIRQGESLAAVTTTSLEALRAYTEAVSRHSRGEEAEALALLEAATELDPDFGMAWRKLAVLIQNMGADPVWAEEAVRRAYALRERMSQTERWLTEAYYFTHGESEPQRAIQAYERVLARFPDEPTALNNLSLLLANVDTDRSVELLERAVAGPSGIFVAYTNLLSAYWDVRRDTEADALAETILERYPTSAVARDRVLDVMTMRGRFAEAHDLRVDNLNGSSMSDGRRVRVQTQLAAEDVGLGRVREARDHIDAAVRLAEAAERPTWATDALAQWAYAVVFLGLETSAGMEAVDQARELLPLHQMAGNGWTAAQLVAGAALLGRQGVAETMLAEFDQAKPAPGLTGDERIARRYMEWAVALGRGDTERALEAITAIQVDDLRCRDRRCWGWWERGRALEAAGRFDEARSMYARAIDGADLIQARWWPMLLIDSLQRLASLAEDAGDVEQARSSYARLVELWIDADAELQPRVAHARARLAALHGGER